MVYPTSFAYSFTAGAFIDHRDQEIHFAKKNLFGIRIISLLSIVVSLPCAAYHCGTFTGAQVGNAAN